MKIQPSLATRTPAPIDRYVMRPVRFEPDTVVLTPQMAGRPVPDPGQVVYYDGEADRQESTLYYASVSNLIKNGSGAELYRGLQDLVARSHRALDYDPEQHLYPWVDRRPSLKLDSIYDAAAEKDTGATQDPGGLWILADGGEGPSTLVFSEREKRIYNCEHVVPQSWFDKKGPMRGDLHHLFTCDIDCNSLRGNSIYVEFNGKGDEVWPSCGLTDHERDRFEPYGGKGAVARAVLYFILRYPGEVGDESGEFTEKDLPLLKKWAREGPVTEYERHRNRAIQQRQGNRNPLVDFPELVDRIDFSRGLGRRRG